MLIRPRELNRLDAQIGREVWFNFWDTKLTYELLPGPTQLCSPESCKAWTGGDGQSISLVLCGMV